MTYGGNTVGKKAKVKKDHHLYEGFKHAWAAMDLSELTEYHDDYDNADIERMRARADY